MFCIVVYDLQSEKIQKMTSNIFLQIFARFKDTQTINEIAQNCKKQLNISVYQSFNLKVGDILHKFQHLEKKYSKSGRGDNSLQWKQDQKKLYLCFLLAFSHVLLKKISEITQNQWEQISQAFYHKNILLMKYEAKVVDRNCERVHWQIEQEQLLCHCINSQMNGKWASISRHIFFESKGQAFKTPKQCRQHWFNHMNKSLKHGEWDIEQDLAILYSVLDYGHKWARVVDSLQGKRTEHMIKNRFHSLLACFSKINKLKQEQRNQSKLVKMIINELHQSKIKAKKGGEGRINNYKLSQQSQLKQSKKLVIQYNHNKNHISQKEEQKQVVKEEQQEIIGVENESKNMNIEHCVSALCYPNIISPFQLPYLNPFIMGNNIQTYSNHFFALPYFMTINTTYQQ